MAKMTLKHIDAGMIGVDVLYPHIKRGDDEHIRRKKRQLTSAAQQGLNNRNSTLKLELDLATNYRPGDLVATLTYDDDHLPFRRSQCLSALKYFRRKLSAEYKAHGATLVLFWNTEHRHGDGRWHHHVVINAADVDYQRIAELWGRGSVKIERLKLGTHPDPKRPGKKKEYSYGGLASYMTKERPDKPSDRCWSYTLTAKHPTTTKETVEGGYTLNKPSGTHQLDKWGRQLEPFGFFGGVKYLKTDQPRRTTKKRRRKK